MSFEGRVKGCIFRLNWSLDPRIVGVSTEGVDSDVRWWWDLCGNVCGKLGVLPSVSGVDDVGAEWWTME